MCRRESDMLTFRLLATVSVGLGLAAVGVSSGQQRAMAPASPSRDSAGEWAGPAAEVLALERQVEDAIVRGDVAFVDRVTPADFRFVHGDGWTRGGQPFASDDKAAFLRRVASHEYLVHDLDNVKVEMHGDVAITYGRYVSLFVPSNRDPADPVRLSSIWFERVYARRNGQWQFLSHRTVHGPNVAPAGVDPTAESRN